MEKTETPEINIRRIARLARIHVEDAEIPVLEKEMGSIVRMVEDLPVFADTSLPLDENDAMPLRHDEEGASSPRDEILENAPQTEAGCVVVPKVVE